MVCLNLIKHVCNLNYTILYTGILLHYDDPALSDVYFIDPQWLCSMLACVVTIHEKNSFQKNGMRIMRYK